MSPDLFVYFLAAVFSAVLLVLGFSWIFARWWCKPERKPGQKTPADYRLESSAIQFNSQGIPLKGWFIPGPAGEQPWPTILMMHGWSRNAAELLPLAAVLRGIGFAVLLFDARGHGRSGQDGPITIRKFTQDILAGVDTLAARPDVNAGRLGLFGRSLGGSSAILAAAQELRIRALVSCSAFADPRPLTRDTLRMMHLPTWPLTGLVCFFIEHWLGTSMKNVAPVNQIARIAAPILLVHGEKDRYIKPNNLDILFSHAAPDQAEKFVVPGRGHSDVLRDSRCLEQIASFFSKNLQQGKGQAAADSLSADKKY